MNEPTDSRTTLTLNQSERKFNLPAELVEQIILYLPIDQHLQSIALASRLFGQSILNKHFLANAHLKQSIAHVELKRWRLVVPIELARKDWFHLPFVYKCALYAWYSVNGPPVKLYDLPLYPSLYLRLHTWLMDTHPHVKMNLGYLAKAISDGNLEIARDCLARVEDREFLKGFRCVPILRALRQGSKKTADVLMQLVELAPFIHNGNTLVAASEGNHALLVRELLASQLSETYILSHGRLAVQKAALSGALDAITALLEDPRIHDDDDNEALCCALKEGHSDIAWRFMQRSNFMPTANVFQNSSTDREIRFILNHPRMDFSTVDCISGLISHHWMTSTPRHTHLVELLKSDKADPTLNDNLAIISAAKYGLQDIVDLLLQDSRVDPGAQNNKALVEACSGRFCKLDVVASLLRHPRVDPGPLLSNPMYFNHIFDAACSIGNVALVKQCLLQDNTDLSASNCMSIAAQNMQFDIVRILIQDGRANPTVDKNAVIVSAARSADWDLVQLLLQDPRVDPSGSGLSGSTNDVLVLAAEENQLELVKQLLADPRVDPYSRSECLFYVACGNNNGELLRYLLQDFRICPREVIWRWNPQWGDIDQLLHHPGLDDQDRWNIKHVIACRSGYVEQVKLTLLDPDFNNSRHAQVKLGLARELNSPELTDLIEEKTNFFLANPAWHN